MINGIDVSQYQGLIDFNTLKDSIDFMWIRANFGTPNNSSVLNLDTMFERNKTLVRQTGIPHGFFHFAYPQYNTPQSEALYFASIVDIQQNELLALDFEEPVSDPVNWVLTFLQTLSNSFGGYKPLVYMNLNLSNSYDWSPVINAGFGSWIAAYDGNTAMPVTKWSVVAFKQWTDTATVPGISGQVDGDVFYGDISQFNKYGYQPPVIQKIITQPVVSTPVESSSPTTQETTSTDSSTTTSPSTTDTPDQSSVPVSSIQSTESSNIPSTTSTTAPIDTIPTSTPQSTLTQPVYNTNTTTSTNSSSNNWILSVWNGIISFFKRIFGI